MVGMGIREDARGTWFLVGVGALIGVVLGILVSVTTDVPLAPEAGVILGALVGWLFHRVGTR
jgi:prepilin signal peptidase PulO-like enzyme (type II secretory pathway)